MPVVTLGLNHNSAPIAVRERVVFPEERLIPALRDLRNRPGVAEAALITTCNRTEVYAVLAREAGTSVLQHWLEESHGLAAGWLSDYAYRHADEAAIRHLMEVASGLDSLVLGEPQILGQTKVAYQAASEAGSMGQVLERLFQHAFAVAKQVRSQTDIGAHPVSVAYAAVSLARQIFGDLGERTALLIGAGETIGLTARHLARQGVTRLIVANRNPERAQALAAEHGARGIGLGEIPAVLADADIVVASTASALPVLGKGTVERALRQRKHRPVFMVDIAVPRDIEPEVSELPDVYLYTIDDLREVIDDSLRSRRAAAQQAEDIVRMQCARFHDWLRSLDSVAAIRRYRARAERERDELLERARRRLARGDAPEAVLEYLADALTRRLIHEPTVGLREAARTGDHETILLSHRLLGLDRPEDDDTP